MRVLLDECIDRKLAREIVGHTVKTVPQMGWAGIKNGQLLGLAEADFDVFVTVDRNLMFQQNLPQFNIAVVVIHAPSNRLLDLRLAIAELLAILPTATKGEATIVRVEV
ncbi:MAG: hypothetical protein Fur0046_04950 [Cyanobacteria bacterium J069]|nr:MAG: hypothetical protein D6742_05500 [Cyanobacteria bacterium J069]